jgi:hypothetical protein
MIGEIDKLLTEVNFRPLLARNHYVATSDRIKMLHVSLIINKYIEN